MPRKYVAKKGSASTGACRRSKRIAYRIKCMVKGQSEFSKEQPSSMKERGKLPNRKKSKPKPESSKGQPSSTTENGKSSYTKKSEAKTQPASSKGQSPSTIESGKPSCSKKTVTKRKSQPTSRKKSNVKKRRVMEIDEIDERASEMGVKEQEEFSSYIKFILGELCTDLSISEEAIEEMNIYFTHLFERLARRSAVCLIERNGDEMTAKDVEDSVVQGIDGELAKYCICEGRRAVKKWDEALYKEMYKKV